MGKALQRMELLDRIGRELQARFSYSDIGDYLSAYVKINRQYEGPNSKWLYSKYQLSDAGLDTLMEIANELGLNAKLSTVVPTSSPSPKNWVSVESKRCFISHLSKDKLIATRLSSCMSKYD